MNNVSTIATWLHTTYGLSGEGDQRRYTRTYLCLTFKGIERKTYIDQHKEITHEVYIFQGCRSFQDFEQAAAFWRHCNAMGVGGM